MNKRLKRNWEGSGGEGGRDIKRERNKREKEKKKLKEKKKGLTDSAHAAQHAAAEGMGRRSPAPLCFTCFLTHRAIPFYLWEENTAACVQGKEPIMSRRQRSVSPWLFIGLPERWTLCSLRGFISTFSPSPSGLSGLWQAECEWDVEELAENPPQRCADRLRCELRKRRRMEGKMRIWGMNASLLKPSNCLFLGFFFCSWSCTSWLRDHDF